ncbi:MAG: hypothetical protein RBR07_00825 [Arcobacteraceae bacterium]|nr:hypothetical protein [Arcobacteraceae bacterium]
MKKSILATLLASVLGVSAFAVENDKNLFVVVTTDDSVTQMMSMVISTQALKKGANVEILMCGKAGDLVILGSKEVLLKPKDQSPQMMLKNLISKGVNVEVCPPYLPNANKSSTDLIQGVRIADPSLVTDKILDKNTQILSY